MQSRLCSWCSAVHSRLLEKIRFSDKCQVRDTDYSVFETFRRQPFFGLLFCEESQHDNSLSKTAQEVTENGSNSLEQSRFNFQQATSDFGDFHEYFLLLAMNLLNWEQCTKPNSCWRNEQINNSWFPLRITDSPDIFFPCRLLIVIFSLFHQDHWPKLWEHSGLWSTPTYAYEHSNEVTRRLSGDSSLYELSLQERDI